MNHFAELPIGWVEATLGDLMLKLQYGYTASASYEALGTRLLRITDIQKGAVDWNTVPGCEITDEDFEKYQLEDGDFVFARTGSIEKAWRVSGVQKAVFASYLIRGKLALPDVTPWLEQFIHTLSYLTQIGAAGAGIGRQNVNAKKLAQINLPIPPLNEQRRIVAKIETLKARSQQAKEALEAIPPLLDQFRQSVLAAAFRGDLTADWREKNLAVDWETTTLEQAIKSKPRNGYSPKPVDYPTQVKSLTLSATTSGKFKSEYFKYIDETIPADSHLWLTPGDILIQRSNTLDYVGTCAIYDGSFGEFIYPDLMMKFQVREEKAIPKFIYYGLSTKTSRQYFRNNATGTAGNMPKINQKVVMDTPIYLPTIEEQKEIVCRIESFLKAADQIAQQYREVKAHLELLDQSILAKAFRGELVPQDPNDEPASVLLERIRAERAKREAEAKAAKKSTGKANGRRSRKVEQQDSESIQLGLPGLE